jgi:hypothetical protein
VLAYANPSPPALASSPYWSNVAYFDRVVVLYDDHPTDTASRYDRLIKLLRAEPVADEIRDRALALLIATATTERGDVATTVQSYRNAGVRFPIGPEVLATSVGYAQRGDLSTAWREALIGYTMQPASAPVHAWMSDLLRLRGFGKQSAFQASLARALDQDR